MIERNIKKLAKMKTKTFFFLGGFLITTVFLIWILTSSNTHLQKIVSETEQQFKDINSKFDVLNPKEQKKDLKIESTYLELLGFLSEPKLFNEIHKNDSLKESLFPSLRFPPIITAFSSFSNAEKMLIKSKLKYFENDLMLIYDLDLSSSEQLKVIFIFF